MNNPSDDCLTLSVVVLNFNGLSLVELTITLALSAGVGLVALDKLQQSQDIDKKLTKSIEMVSIESTVLSYVLSQYGCEQISNLPAGSNFKVFSPKRNFDKATGKFVTTQGKVVFEEGMRVGDVEISKMEITSIEASNASADQGFAKLNLTMESQSEQRSYEREILVPVQLSAGQVSGCGISQDSLYEYLYAKLCTEAYGPETAGMTCAQAVLYVEDKIKASVCLDITGSLSNFNQATGFCDFSNVHNGKSCPGGQIATGFNAAGAIRCKSI